MFLVKKVFYLCLSSNLADTEFVVDTVGKLVLVKMSICKRLRTSSQGSIPSYGLGVRFMASARLSEALDNNWAPRCYPLVHFNSFET